MGLLSVVVFVLWNAGLLGWKLDKLGWNDGYTHL